MTTRLAIIGYGKIAAEQHVPAITRHAGFELAALVDPELATDETATLAHFDSLDALIDSGIALDAVVLAVPPQLRHGLAIRAITAGWHVLLEKPPGISLSELVDIERRADEHGVVVQASWHSRHAPAVEAARAHLADRRVQHIDIDWREDVTVTHPGQAWIWQPGGLGVFDPGINALSILSRICPTDWRMTQAHLEIPANRAAPITARLSLADTNDAPGEAVFDFRHTGTPRWVIDIVTADSRLQLADGGARLTIDDEPVIDAEKDEYRGVYDRFARCIANGRSDIDATPFRLTADAFLIATRETVDAFHE